MAVPLEQFVKHLEGSGILAGDTIQDFIPPKASPRDAEELVRELVRQKKLTKFQAEQVWQGKGKSLVLGNYLLLEKIGQGGMGAVYKAEHRRMKRIVAVKMLPVAMTQDQPTIARFQREVEAVAKLNHSNIVAAFDADNANGSYFLVMEFVEGSDLSVLVKKNGPLPVGQAVNCILQAARGLQAAHAEGIVHRDIKPANLLLDTKGTVKILDMGLARIAGDVAGQAELTGTGAVMGTVDYMAPEQARSTKTADARADIYSLGCSLFYLLTGKATYDGETLTGKLLAHQTDPIPMIRAIRPEVPGGVEAIFTKMVAKRVGDRYQTMTEVIADLEACGTSQDQSAGTQQPFGSSTDEGLTNFLKEIAVGAPKPILPKKSAGPLFGKEKNRLLIGGGVLGVMILLAGLVLALRTKDSTLAKGGGKKSIAGKQTTVSTKGWHDWPAHRGGNHADRALYELVNQATKPATTLNDPAIQKWMNEVAEMSAEDQVKAVAKRLQELNPGFDGKVTPTIDFLDLAGLQFASDDVTDISPVRALPKLKTLDCSGSSQGRGRLADLSPLKGLALASLKCNYTQVSDLAPLKGLFLTSLDCSGSQISDLSPLEAMPLTFLNFMSNPVSDLSPLKGMPLTTLYFAHSQVSDLSPLKGMLLTSLQCGVTPVCDLSPLKGMPLKVLLCQGTKVSDLTPLKDMPLTMLLCNATQVFDLSPLKGMPLVYLQCNSTPVSDLTPLNDLPLKTLIFDFKPDRDTELLRSIKTLETINEKPAAEFWKEVEERQKGKQP